MKPRVVLLGLGLLAFGVANFSCRSTKPMMAKKSGKKSGKMTGKKTGKVTVDLSEAFDHGTHARQLTLGGDRLLGCNDCHTLTGTSAGQKFPICGETQMPYPEHNACNKCHAKAFRTRPLQICTNCHTKNEISEQPPMKPLGQRALLRPTYSHKLHVNPMSRVQSRFGKKKDCTFCHEFVRGGEEVLLPKHAQCCECHTTEHLDPSINDCGSCHTRSEDAKRKKGTLRYFSHADHTLDPTSGETLACTRCHGDVDSKDTVAAVGVPKMSTCITCHQGEIAFDYANCLKCHAKGIEKLPLPPDHPR